MKKSLGNMIAEHRKEKGMTQLELAQKLGVTDKAVSKWERDLSCPDISSLPQLADILEVSVDELMQVEKTMHKEVKDVHQIIDTVLKADGVAMGIAVVVLSLLNEIDVKSSVTMLGIGLSCVAISLLKNK